MVDGEVTGEHAFQGPLPHQPALGTELAPEGARRATRLLQIVDHVEIVVRVQGHGRPVQGPGLQTGQGFRGECPASQNVSRAVEALHPGRPGAHHIDGAPRVDHQPGGLKTGRASGQAPLVHEAVDAPLDQGADQGRDLLLLGGEVTQHPVAIAEIRPQVLIDKAGVTDRPDLGEGDKALAGGALDLIVRKIVFGSALPGEAGRGLATVEAHL